MTTPGLHLGLGVGLGVGHGEVRVDLNAIAAANANGGKGNSPFASTPPLPAGGGSGPASSSARITRRRQPGQVIRRGRVVPQPRSFDPASAATTAAALNATQRTVVAMVTEQSAPPERVALVDPTVRSPTTLSAGPSGDLLRRRVLRRRGRRYALTAFGRAVMSAMQGGTGG